MLLSKKTVVLRRGFAAAAAATAPATRVTPTTGVRGFEEKVSKMSDGLTVASVDLEGPISQVLFSFFFSMKNQRVEVKVKVD
jgi:hypothetical protein